MRLKLRDIRFVVPFWYPIFFMMIGVVHFIGTGFSLFLLSKVEVFNLQALIELGSTNPPFFIFLSVVAVFDLCVIMMGWYMLFHTEKEI